MIDYKLAKKLKEAGWKYHLPSEGKENWDGKVVIFKDGGAALPTLSELIEASGDGFVSLTHFDTTKKDAWRAEQHTPMGILEERGNSPEEAVAKLWLESKADNN